LPDLSVTINPTGYAYQVAREIIDALHRQCPEPGCADFEPHVTLQYVKDAESVEPALAALEPIALRIAPFEIKFGSVGSFESPPGVHIDLEPTEGLIRAYKTVKCALDDVGLRTYAYDASTWRPHLTLSCGHWSLEDVAFIRGLFTRLDASFQADRMLVNRLEDDGRWVVERVLALDGTSQDVAAEAA
jgi:2'-5' RNA ligase